MVTISRMRIQQAVLAALADSGNSATPERLRHMLRRFPTESVDEAVHHLTDAGMVEVGEYRGRVRARLTEHFRIHRGRPRTPSPAATGPPAPPEPEEPPISLPPVPYASSDMVHQALVVIVEEARRFVRGEVYLGPFMKRRMNAEFPLMTNEERKGLIDHLRAQGCVRIEKRMGERGEYSVLLIDQTSPAVRQVWKGLASGRIRLSPASAAGSPRASAATFKSAYD